MNFTKLKIQLLQTLPNVINPTYRFNKLNKVILANNLNGFLTIKSGPFKDMLYISESNGSKFTPKLLGTYELELYPVIEEIMKKKWDHLIVAGTGEGYYAVGLNYKYNINKNSFFELDSSAIDNLDKLAKINNFSNFKLQGICSSYKLNEIIIKDEKTLIFMDIEGAEKECLDLIKVPLLKDTTIIVEIHDFIDPLINNLIIARFSKSHKIFKIAAKPRLIDDFNMKLSILDRLVIKEKYILTFMSENRPSGMHWLVLEPKI
jgi:hypothetical protein